MIALATHLSLDSDQLDIESEFLNGDRVVEINMVLTPGIGLHWKILERDKLSHGLQRAPLVWFE